MAKKKKAAKKKKSAKAKKKPAAAKKSTALATTADVEIERLDDEIERDWLERLTELRNRRENVAANLLQFYYDVGQLAIEMENEKAKDPKYRKYGAHSMDEAAAFIGVGKTSLYNAVQFANDITEKDLQRMKDAAIPWRTVQKMLTYDEAQRTEIIDRIEKGELDTTKESVTDDNGGTEKDPPKTGMELAISQVKSFNTVAKQTEAKAVPNLVAAVHEYQTAGGRASKKSVAEFASLIGEARDHISTMNRLLDSAEKAVGEVVTEA